MAKVELDNLTLGHSKISDEVFIGIANKDGNRWLKKANVTNSFIGAVISRWEGKKEIISQGDQKWEISCKKIK
jgi:hypothetical protein